MIEPITENAEDLFLNPKYENESDHGGFSNIYDGDLSYGEPSFIHDILFNRENLTMIVGRRGVGKTHKILECLSYKVRRDPEFIPAVFTYKDSKIKNLEPLHIAPSSIWKDRLEKYEENLMNKADSIIFDDIHYICDDIRDGRIEPEIFVSFLEGLHKKSENGKKVILVADDLLSAYSDAIDMERYDNLLLRIGQASPSKCQDYEHLNNRNPLGLIEWPFPGYTDALEKHGIKIDLITKLLFDNTGINNRSIIRLANYLTPQISREVAENILEPNMYVNPGVLESKTDSEGTIFELNLEKENEIVYPTVDGLKLIEENHPKIDLRAKRIFTEDLCMLALERLDNIDDYRNKIKTSYNKHLKKPICTSFPSSKPEYFIRVKENKHIGDIKGFIEGSRIRKHNGDIVGDITGQIEGDIFGNIEGSFIKKEQKESARKKKIKIRGTIDNIFLNNIKANIDYSNIFSWGCGVGQINGQGLSCEFEYEELKYKEDNTAIWSNKKILGAIFSDAILESDHFFKLKFEGEVKTTPNLYVLYEPLSKLLPDVWKPEKYLRLIGHETS